MRSTYFAHGGRRRHRQDLIFPIRHRLIAFAVGNCFLYTSYNHPIWIIKETMLKAVAYLSYAWVVQLHRHRLNLRNLDREFLLGFSFVGCACILLEIQPSVSSLSLSLSLFFFLQMSVTLSIVRLFHCRSVATSFCLFPQWNYYYYYYYVRWIRILENEFKKFSNIVSVLRNYFNSWITEKKSFL